MYWHSGWLYWCFLAIDAWGKTCYPTLTCNFIISMGTLFFVIDYILNIARVLRAKKAWVMPVNIFSRYYLHRNSLHDQSSLRLLVTCIAMTTRAITWLLWLLDDYQKHFSERRCPSVPTKEKNRGKRHLRYVLPTLWGGHEEQRHKLKSEVN